MQSLKELFRIGSGPSSSHSMGPEAAAIKLKALYPDANFKITLCGSLALTGKGHGTDAVLEKVLGDRVEIAFDFSQAPLPHPNTMKVEVISGGRIVANHTVSGRKDCRNARSLQAQQFRGDKADDYRRGYPYT